MNKFYPLTIREVRPETREAVSLCFDLSEELRETFRYRQGQHLVLRTHLDGEEVRRSYSICTGVNDRELRIAVKKVPGGRFSTHAHEHLRPGQTLDVMPPQGQFYVDLDPQREGNYLAVAAGSGITPILSIVKTTLETEPKSQVTLLYGNRSTASTMFRESLEDLKNRFMGRFNLVFVFSREEQDIDLYNGRIDADKCDALFDHWLNAQTLTAAFVCGPQVMTETVRDSLQRHGLDKARIHYELFTPADGGKPPRQERTETTVDPQAVSQVTVRADGRALTFDLTRNTRSILDAGNDMGADLPFSCKAGVCSTCKAKVLEGEVEMDANYALEDYEVEAGYVLSCQCYPVSDKVVLDYDEV
ncbi:phenylacetate-CoA oxygenase/reductase subunit PaaK [Billgrantia tianxiuensis]|jgi:ring-1,2-phenylacetyl-CoA epoxidase subunit PaaE|uniref:Phenylacetate-CoA oxygenase/reductase subunit PaaK n=1 Tax=Billgrantia tianxiuensis TaxID=2497861 RepID=A0A6I6SL37_9GAMM|nr:MULTISPECIES: 1,2-phenylacetyl-CoA epoxidase subunit PaaE [Halomonas]MCE8036008.1 phenylacetate-CoA oxygenase/reductase subunit PaaK [Halomonas sp. MCCC 1A11057]QHC48357.1 phenylacetate-CoA oxygenase/reductase subunit PaaK [Halomonas tianxiuensis]